MTDDIQPPITNTATPIPTATIAKNVKSKGSTKVHKFKVHYYGGEVWLVTSRYQFELTFCKLHGHTYADDVELADGLCCPPVNYKGNVVYLIGIFEKYAGLIVHETNHLCIFILRRAGMNPMDDDGESLCYLAEHFFNEFIVRVLADNIKQAKESSDAKTVH